MNNTRLPWLSSIHTHVYHHLTKWLVCVCSAAISMFDNTHRCAKVVAERVQPKKLKTDDTFVICHLHSDAKALEVDIFITVCVCSLCRVCVCEGGSTGATHSTHTAVLMQRHYAGFACVCVWCRAVQVCCCMFTNYEIPQCMHNYLAQTQPMSLPHSEPHTC